MLNKLLLWENSLSQFCDKYSVHGTYHSFYGICKLIKCHRTRTCEKHIFICVLRHLWYFYKYKVECDINLKKKPLYNIFIINNIFSASLCNKKPHQITKGSYFKHSTDIIKL